MIIVKQVTDKERIVLKYKLSALDVVFCLQRKCWHGWKTTAWIYPSCIKHNDFDYVIHWLHWSEEENSSEQSIGKKMSDKYNADIHNYRHN